MWMRVGDHVRATLKGVGSPALAPGAQRAELAELVEILERDVPDMRRLAAPMDYATLRKRGFAAVGAALGFGDAPRRDDPGGDARDSGNGRPSS